MNNSTGGFTLFLIISNLILVIGLVTSWIKAIKNSKEDPRLSKGLQLLQSKISVLEDLSDRTQSQTQKLNMQLDNKLKEVKDLCDLIDKKSESLEKQITQAISERVAAHVPAPTPTVFTPTPSPITNPILNTVPQTFVQSKVDMPSVEGSAGQGYSDKEKYNLAAEMIRNGYSALEVVRELNLTVGEVHFISKIQNDNMAVAKKSNDYSAANFQSQIQKHLSNHTRNMNENIRTNTQAQPSPAFALNTTNKVAAPEINSPTDLKKEIKPYIFKKV